MPLHYYSSARCCNFQAPVARMAQSTLYAFGGASPSFFASLDAVPVAKGPNTTSPTVARPPLSSFIREAGITSGSHHLSDEGRTRTPDGSPTKLNLLIT